MFVCWSFLQITLNCLLAKMWLSLRCIHLRFRPMFKKIHKRGGRQQETLSKSHMLITEIFYELKNTNWEKGFWTLLFLKTRLQIGQQSCPHFWPSKHSLLEAPLLKLPSLCVGWRVFSLSLPPPLQSLTSAGGCYRPPEPKEAKRKQERLEHLGKFSEGLPKFLICIHLTWYPKNTLSVFFRYLFGSDCQMDKPLYVLYNHSYLSRCT